MLEFLDIIFYESLITEKWFFEQLALITKTFPSLKVFKVSLYKNDIGKIHKKIEYNKYFISINSLDYETALSEEQSLKPYS